MVRQFSRVVAVIIATCVVFSTVPRTADARDSDLLSFGAGGFDILRSGASGEFRLEYRSGYELVWIVKPLVGVMGTTDEAFYGYGGILMDIELGRFVITPSLTVGYYEDGDGPDLGHEVEFRTGVEVSYRFENDMRLGIAFYHMSNASIGDENPGAEILEAVFSIPLNF